MTTQPQPFSATNPPDQDDMDGLAKWAEEITRRNREFAKQERRIHDATRNDPDPYL